MNCFKEGDKVWINEESWIIEMVMCARIYIRNKKGKMIVPRFDEVKPIKTCYATLGKTGV